MTGSSSTISTCVPAACSLMQNRLAQRFERNVTGHLLRYERRIFLDARSEATRYS
jgi:hypothetical protein